MRHSLVGIFVAILLAASGVARADVVSIESVYYVADSGLRSVGFDGSNFVGAFQQHQVVDPNWTAMTYVPALSRIWYVADAGLRSVGFDGSNFVGAFQQHQVVDPNWTAMSLILKSTPDDGGGPPVPEPATMTLFGVALAGIFARAVCRRSGSTERTCCIDSTTTRGHISL